MIIFVCLFQKISDNRLFCVKFKFISSCIFVLFQINLEVQARMQDKETSDLTHLKILGKADGFYPFYHMVRDLYFPQVSMVFFMDIFESISFIWVEEIAKNDYHTHSDIQLKQQGCCMIFFPQPKLNLKKILYGIKWFQNHHLV